MWFCVVTHHNVISKFPSSEILLGPKRKHALNWGRVHLMGYWVCWLISNSSRHRFCPPVQISFRNTLKGVLVVSLQASVHSLQESSLVVSASLVVTSKTKTKMKTRTPWCWISYLGFSHSCCVDQVERLCFVLFAGINILVDFGEILIDTVWFGGALFAVNQTRKLDASWCSLDLLGCTVPAAFIILINIPSWDHGTPYLSANGLSLRPRRKTVASRAHFFNLLKCVLPKD